MPEQAEYVESVLATNTSLEGMKETFSSWPPNLEHCETEISYMHQDSILELMRSTVLILDFEM